MKNLYFFLFIAFISGILGSWIGGLFVPLFWNGLAFKDSLFSGIGTWIGSIGTIGTLIYLIYQNNQLREGQRENERKQQDMWDHQREIIAFQKIQTHKKEFNAILDDLESNFPITFSNRIGFYGNIFPANNFEKCSPKVLLAKEDNQVIAGDLSDIRDAAKFIKKSIDEVSLLDSKNFYRHTHDHLRDVSLLMSTLHISIIPPMENGDVYRDMEVKYFILNVIDPSLTLKIIEAVVNTLMQFTGNKDNCKVSLANMCTSFYLNALQNFAFTNTHYRGYFVFKKNNLGNYINDLFNILLIIRRPELIKNESFVNIRQRLNSLFNNKKELLSILDSQEQLCDLFKEILYEIAAYSDENEQAQEFHMLRCKIRIIIDELMTYE